MKSWFKRHMQVFFYTLGQFSRNRLNVSMTMLALGIGLSIPLIMYSVVDSLSDIGGQWQERPQITLYLEKSINETQTEALRTDLAKDSRLGDIQFISAEEGLKEFSAYHQFDEAIALLDENPLPAVFVVFPLAASSTNEIAALSNELEGMGGIASAQYDFEWMGSPPPRAKCKLFAGSLTSLRDSGHRPTLHAGGETTRIAGARLDG
jgi:cell division transport system permease protein